MCDTEYIIDGRADYMSLEVSADGSNFVEVDSRDEWSLDDDDIE
jgi:hypothetical protein